MGYYIETELPDGKTSQLLKKYSCTQLGMRDASEPGWKTSQARAICHKLMEDFDLVVVVTNGGFDAAAYAFDQRELDHFMSDEDKRTRGLLVFPKGMAAELSGYNNAAA